MGVCPRICCIGADEESNTWSLNDTAYSAYRIEIQLLLQPVLSKLSDV